MTAPLQAVLFDLDGTLLDTAPDLINALNKAFIDLGYHAQFDSNDRAIVSNGAQAMIMHALKGVKYNESNLHALREHMLSIYTQNICEDTRPFSGIPLLLKKLEEQHIKWGIVTNKPWQFTQPLINAIELNPAPGTIVCPDHVTKKKPDPEGLLTACKTLGVQPSNCIYIGDHQRDIESAKNANMMSIAAAYGYIQEHEAVDSWHANHIVQTASEIWPIFERYL